MENRDNPKEVKSKKQLCEEWLQQIFTQSPSCNVNPKLYSRLAEQFNTKEKRNGKTKN